MSSSSTDFYEEHIPNGRISQSVELCNMCTKNGPAVSRCNTCNRYLCNNCDIAHKLMVCFQTHQVISLDKNVSEDVKKCVHHPDETLIYYCCRCNIAVCYQCVLTDHVSHDCCNISEYCRKEVDTEIKNLYYESKSRLDHLGYLNSELNVKFEDLERYRSSVITYINEMHQQYEEILRKYRDVVITKVEEDCNMRQEILIRTKLELEKIINDFTVKITNIKLSENFEKASVNGFGPNSTSSSSSLSLRNTAHSDVNNSLPSLNFDIDELLADEHVRCAEDLISKEPPNLPLVSNLIKQEFCVNPDPSPKIHSDPISSPPYCTNQVNSMQIYKTFGQKGNSPGQFNSPHGFCLGFNEDIVVADSSNHRIQVFTKSGSFKFQFGISGRHDGHLWHPRKVAVLPNKRLYVVCDRGYERSRMQIFSEDGQFLKKIYIQYIDIVAGIAITEDENIVVVDSVTPTVFIIGQNEFLRSLDCKGFMEEPSDIAIIGKEFYICDFKGHSIVVIDDEGNFLRKFGDKQITNFPNGIDVTAKGEVLIGDSHGNFFHVSVYSKDGEFIAEFRCPYVKVSRCCGLKVTSEGYLVTVDKNYHHVIMLDSIYITRKSI